MSQAEPEQETAASVLPGLPRVAALDALLREVDGLRLSLETDLSMAAAAVEVGEIEVAADILEQDRRELRHFERRSLGHLTGLAREVELSRRRRPRRLLPAAPFVAAAAVVGFLTGVVPSHLAGGSTDTRTTNAASTSLLALTELASGTDTARVRAQAISLHDQLAPLVAQARRDPVAAQQALALLTQERVVLSRSGDQAGLADVLRASRMLTSQLTAALPAAVRPVASTLLRLQPGVVVALPQVTSPTRPQPTSTASTPPSVSTSAPARLASASAQPRTQQTARPTPLPSSTPPAVGPTLPAQLVVR